MISRRPCGLGLHGRFNIITADVTSSGNGSDDEDSSEMSYPTVFPGWDRSVAKDEYAPSTSKEIAFTWDAFFLLLCPLHDISPPFCTHILCEIYCPLHQPLFKRPLLCLTKNPLDVMGLVFLEVCSSSASGIGLFYCLMSDFEFPFAIVSQRIASHWRISVSVCHN